MKQEPYSIAKTVQKAFKLMEILAEKQPARPSELIQKLNLSKSNVYRLLWTLREMGYIEQTGDSKFRFSFKMFILGNTIPIKNQIIDIAHPYMIRLAEISQENVNLAVMFEQKVLYIDKIESSQYLKLDQPIGSTDPLHCTALGKILLTGMTDSELETFLESTPLNSYTKNTITDPKILTSVIRNIREQGYAVDLEELGEGIHCIGAPIYDYTNKVIAGISISAPKMRLTNKKIKRLKTPLVDIAAEVSKKWTLPTNN